MLGSGDDGLEYLIDFYKKRWTAEDGQVVEEPDASIFSTSDGVELHRMTEQPLVFFVPSTQVTILAGKPNR